MNYLGHLVLSGQDEYILVGNFLVDRLSLQETRKLIPNYSIGVSLHHHIDEITDRHPYFKKALKILYPVYRKYAPVILDVFMDYLITSNWDKITAENFDVFQSRVYDVLLRHLDQMPKDKQAKIQSMIDHTWLEAYTTWDGLVDVFGRMDNRTSFNSEFVMQVDFLKKNEARIEDGFIDFMSFMSDSCSTFMAGS